MSAGVAARCGRRTYRKHRRGVSQDPCSEWRAGSAVVCKRTWLRKGLNKQNINDKLCDLMYGDVPSPL